MSHIKTIMNRFFTRTSCKSHEHMFKRLEKYRLVEVTKFWNHPATRFLNDKLTVIRNAVGKQGNAIVAQRLRRSAQMLALYRYLGGEKAYSVFIKSFVNGFGTKLQNRRLCFMLGAVLFSWVDERVTDNELISTAEELKQFVDTYATPKKQNIGQNFSAPFECNGKQWEQVYDSETFKLWRTSVPDSALYEYRVYGTYTDVSARAFSQVQIDLDYRKQWDGHVITLEKLEDDDKSDSEVIYWATQFPMGCMYSRDYVYVRRYMISEKRKFMMLTAKSVDHPARPANSNYVRVGTYRCKMFVRPHKSFDENGMDYVMTYFDDPQLSVPSWIINKLTVSSLPCFVETMHDAAKKLCENSSFISRFNSSANTDSYQSSFIRLQQGNS